MKLIDPKMSLDTIKSYIEVWDCDGCLTDGGTQHNVMAVDDLEYLPKIEAEPVRIAEWDGCGGCKACGRSLYELIDSDSYLKTKVELYGTPFCPFCGAKIEGVDNG